jgi:hypothetical protein
MKNEDFSKQFFLLDRYTLREFFTWYLESHNVVVTWYEKQKWQNLNNTEISVLWWFQKIITTAKKKEKVFLVFSRGHTYVILSHLSGLNRVNPVVHRGFQLRLCPLLSVPLPAFPTKNCPKSTQTLDHAKQLLEPAPNIQRNIYGKFWGLSVCLLVVLGIKMYRKQWKQRIFSKIAFSPQLLVIFPENVVRCILLGVCFPMVCLVRLAEQY